MGTVLARAAIPGLPGAQTMSPIATSVESRVTSACSLAPPPTTRTLIVATTCRARWALR